MTPESDGVCCGEFAAMSRRSLMRGALVGGVATTFGSAVVSMASSPAAAADPTAPILVVLSQRGAADGLSLVVPHAETQLYKSRPNTAIPKGSLWGADDTFGFHPALSGLQGLWNAGQLAAIHATGLAVANRSHFSAMEEVEDAAPGSRTRDGWLNRLLGTMGTTDPLAGFSVGTPPTALFGKNPTMSISGLGSAGFSNPFGANRREDSLTAMWGPSKQAIGVPMRTALATTAKLKTAKAQPSTSGYPNTDLGRAMSDLARVLRANIGVNLATVDHGDWDMHVGMGSSTGGWMVDQARELSNSIAAFFNDLGSVRSRVKLITISEFGRRVTENSTRGTDHGWGNVMFAVGEGITKGFHTPGGWTELKGTLDADVPVTTDYRDVFADLVTRHMGVSSATVFPGFTRANGDSGLGFLA